MSRFWGALLIVAAVGLVSGCGASIGVVDTQRVLNESVVGLQYQKQLDEREKQMVAELTALQGQVSPAELNARRAGMATQLQQMQVDLEGKLNVQLDDAAGQVARQDGLRLVLVKGQAAVGGTDITQQVIDRLSK